MDMPTVSVPVSLLLDPDQTAASKVLWMARRLNPGAGPAELERKTGLSRHTVLTGLGNSMGMPGGPRVKVPGALLAERAVGAQAKVLYGLLQSTPNFRRQGGQFTHASLGAQTGLGRKTVRKAIGELVGAGWLQITQASRVSPIRFTLGSPARLRSQAELEVVRRRLKRANHGGEAIMQEYLSLLIDCDQFTENARPGFLVSPLTGERLEFDRFYPPDVAFEFNGTQHYKATGRITQAEVDAQRVRDLLKAGLCLYLGIRLVIVHAEDLSLQAMTKKIGQSLPLRNLADKEPLIDLLEASSLCYCASVEAAARSGD